MSIQFNFWPTYGLNASLVEEWVRNIYGQQYDDRPKKDIYFSTQIFKLKLKKENLFLLRQKNVKNIFKLLFSVVNDRGNWKYYDKQDELWANAHLWYPRIYVQYV